ncbi:MAG: hypothetical protein JST26_00210 [Bacteroidetes bacterium]|nr:hypothetical protein [Bacteroidota bacterium]
MIEKSKRKEMTNVHQCAPMCANVTKTRHKCQTPVSSLRRDLIKQTIKT